MKFMPLLADAIFITKKELPSQLLSKLVIFLLIKGNKASAST